MSHRTRLATALVALLAVAGPVGAHGSPAASPSLTLNVNAAGFLELVLGNGTRIRTSSAPGATIPPGPYLVIVNTDVVETRDTFHIFHLSGPGVNLSSDLLPCENPREVGTVTLRPSSTYVYEDSRNAEITRVVVTTSSSGSSAETSSSAPAPSTANASGTVSNSSHFGSAVAPFRGTLIGTVGPAGKLTLSRNGKSVSSLKWGRYKIAVADRTPNGGFTLGRPDGKTVVVTRPSFVGTRTVTLALRAGRWMFFSAAAEKHHFTVVS